MTEEVKVPVPGSPEHDAAMIALAESSNVRIRVSDATSGVSHELSVGKPTNETGEIKPEQKPAAGADEVPEKFRNADGSLNSEALLKSYRDLEAARSKPAVAALPGVQPPVAPAAAPAAAPAQTEAQKAVDTAKAAVTAAQTELTAATTDEAKAAATAKLNAAKGAAFDAAEAAAKAAAAAKTEPPAAAPLVDAMNSAAQDFAKDGNISEQSFVALEKAGVTREYAQQYVDGLKASAQLVEMQVFQESGGKDEYTKMSQWAATNLSAQQIEAHNKAVLSGNLQATLGAVRSMKQLYTAAVGSAPAARIEAENGGAPKGDMFRSTHEMQAAMNDPRYLRGDKAFHAEVDRKLDASIKAGINLGF